MPCSQDMELISDPSIFWYPDGYCSIFPVHGEMKNTTVVTLVTLMPSPAWAASIIDVTPMTNMIFQVLPFVLVVIVLRSLTTSRSFKGWLGEFRVMRAMKRLDEREYRQFHDTTLPTSDGTTQIDHIVVSRYGVFVIETKNMGGWIFGSQNDPTWTQTFGKHRNSFQNPLRQNFKHIKELEALLQIGEDKFHSVIVFAGDATFKTGMPNNVLQSGLARHILSKSDPILSEHEVQGILLKISGAMLDRSRATAKLHVNNLNNKFGTKSSESGESIPLILKLGLPVLLMITALFLLNNGTRPAQKPSQPIQATQLPTPLPTMTTTSLPAESINNPSPYSADTKPLKSPRSSDYGFLTITAQRDTYVTLFDKQNTKVWSKEIKKGHSEEIELKKGSYTAEILYAGKRETSTVSFISNNGILEF